jgi:hypothetical protein
MCRCSCAGWRGCGPFCITPDAQPALAIGFGLAIAIGLNAKYAMIYFPLCALAYLIFTGDSTPLLKRLDLWLGIATGLLGFLPNLIWNIEHRFITFSHTGENISGSGLALNPISFPGVLAASSRSQGRSCLLASCWHLLSAGAAIGPPPTGCCLFFSVPILGLLSLQAFQSSANYNWAATAFPALIIVTTAILMDRARWSWVRWNLITCIAAAVLLAGGALAALAVRPDNPVIARTNLEDMFGWQEHAEELGRRLDRLEPDTIVTVGRRYSAGFAYYMRQRPETLRAFRRDDAARRQPFRVHHALERPKPRRTRGDHFTGQYQPAAWGAAGWRCRGRPMAARPSAPTAISS